jgi:hypothetical protein
MASLEVRLLVDAINFWAITTSCCKSSPASPNSDKHIPSTNARRDLTSKILPSSFIDSREPSPQPSTALPTASPTFLPTNNPPSTLTEYPTLMPTEYPTLLPTEYPTSSPASNPTFLPTDYPTMMPTEHPTSLPTKYPTSSPTSNPTFLPTIIPTSYPTKFPTGGPTLDPTDVPTAGPTSTPTMSPTTSPTPGPTSFLPTYTPTISTMEPTVIFPFSNEPTKKSVNSFKANVKGCLRQTFRNAGCDCKAGGRKCFNLTNKEKCRKLYIRKTKLKDYHKYQSFEEMMNIAYQRECIRRKHGR